MADECRSCLSTLTDSIHLDGICQECRDFEPAPPESREDELRSVLEENQGKRFDILAALSGGKDSIFLLHYLSNVQGRRVLALTWNHNHNRDVVWQNIDNALRNVGDVEWNCFSYRHDYMTMVRQSLLLELKNMCMCAHFVNLRAIEYCVKEDIPFMAFGFSPAQTFRRGKFEILEDEKRYPALSNYTKAFRRLVHHCLRRHYPKKADDVAGYLFQPVEDCLDLADSRNDPFPAFLEISSYIPWDVKSIRKAVRRMGWKSDKSQDGDLHTNCIFEPMRGHIEYLTKKTLLVSELNYNIRSGELTKEEALSELKASGYDRAPPGVSERFLDFIGLPKARFYDELSKPVCAEAREYLVDFVRAGYVVRGYEESANKTIK